MRRDDPRHDLEEGSEPEPGTDLREPVELPDDRARTEFD